jgi:hypothetical protein
MTMPLTADQAAAVTRAHRRAVLMLAKAGDTHRTLPALAAMGLVGVLEACAENDRAQFVADFNAVLEACGQPFTLEGRSTH